MADAMQELPQQPPSDPDAAATVSDFIDYTEFFPSDLFRSLTLIGKLDATYSESTHKIHDLTKKYGILPSLPASERPEAADLRKQISQTLDRAIRCREATFAEASRISDVADRHCNRLVNIKKKLEALPKPPSRDPTPVPVSSPQLSRTRKQDPDHTRITLHIAPSNRAAPAAANLKKGRKITVPGEVLPPPNPDSPPPDTTSEYDSERQASPDDIRAGSVEAPPQSQHGGKPGRIKISKAPKHKLKLPSVPKPRPPGVMGTNVHSQVAGISTSNALAKLDPPPADAKPGSKYMPWNRLTEYEMAKLRKRMKKNAIWTPSDTMVRRELADLGRGKENYDKARALSEASGEPFLDEEPMDPSKPLQPGEISFVPIGAQDMALSNRGMKLNEAKKLKKEILAKEQAAKEALGEVEVSPEKSTDIGKNETTITTAPDKNARKRKRESPTIKPEAKSDSSAPPTMAPANPPKRLKLTTPVLIAPHPAPVTTTTTTQVPLAPPAPSPKKANTASLPKLDTEPTTKKDVKPASPTTAAQSRPRRDSNAVRPRTPATTAPATSSIPATSPRTKLTITRSPPTATAARAPRRGSKAMSAEPQAPSRRSTLRRSSNASLPSTTTSAAPPESVPASATAGVGRRRAKRPTPGPVTKGADGGSAKVSAARRRNAPKGGRRGTTAGATGTGGKMVDGDDVGGIGASGVQGVGEGVGGIEEEEEPIDPDEPKYCSCNRVSFGEMVACDNPNCEIEWFHFECVGLTEEPSGRRWYCLACEKKYGIGKGRSIDAGGSRKK